MGSQRAHIVIPQDLIEEIDSVVGPRGRSAFLVETARAELRKRKLLALLRTPAPIMRDEDYPELATMGTQAWVKKMRRGWETRLDLPEEQGDAGE